MQELEGTYVGDVDAEQLGVHVFASDLMRLPALVAVLVGTAALLQFLEFGRLGLFDLADDLVVQQRVDRDVYQLGVVDDAEDLLRQLK